MTTLFAKVAALLRGPRPADPLRIGSAYLIDGDVHLAVHARDRAGHAYVLRLLPRLPLADGDVGAAVVRSLEAMETLDPGVPAEARAAHWKQLLAAIGHSNRTLAARASLVMLSGTPATGLALQPTRRGRGGFLGLADAATVHCPWSAPAAGSALASAFARCE